MKQRLISILFSSFFLSLLSCAANTESSSGNQIKMAGSTTLDPVMNLVIETYHHEKPDLSLSYEALGSSVGIKNIQDGTIDIAGSSRDLTQAEISSGLVSYIIGHDGLAVITNIDTGIRALSGDQLADIFSGKVTNWQEVGGSSLPITLVKRDESSGTYTSFRELALKGHDYSPQGLVVNSNGDVMSKVAYTTGSIGYIGMSYVSDIDRSRTNVLSINGVSPNRRTVLDQTYPLSREIYLVTKGTELKPSVRYLLDFVLGKEGQELVDSAGFFALSH
jgi:phosphate transport system substrate-binding protein